MSRFSLLFSKTLKVELNFMQFCRDLMIWFVIQTSKYLNRFSQNLNQSLQLYREQLQAILGLNSMSHPHFMTTQLKLFEVFRGSACSLQFVKDTGIIQGHYSFNQEKFHYNTFSTSKVINIIPITLFSCNRLESTLRF